MVDYAVAHLDEIEEIDDGRSPYRPVRHHLGITSFGATAWTARAAGDRLINEHDEADDGHEELYLVTQGHAVFEVDGDRVDAPAGTFVAAPPRVKRGAVAEEAGTTVVVVGAARDKPYEASGWEIWAPLYARYEAGEYAEVGERLRAIVEAHPQYGLLFYNLACCESLTGQTDEAVGHVRQAIELSEKFRTYARHDSDLDALRGDAAFQRLVGDERSGRPAARQRGTARGNRLGPRTRERRLVRRQRPGHAVDDVRALRLRLRVREPGALVPASSGSTWPSSSPASRTASTTPSRSRSRSSCSPANAVCSSTVRSGL